MFSICPFSQYRTLDFRSFRQFFFFFFCWRKDITLSCHGNFFFFRIILHVCISFVYAIKIVCAHIDWSAKIERERVCIIQNPPTWFLLMWKTQAVSHTLYRSTVTKLILTFINQTSTFVYYSFQTHTQRVYINSDVEQSHLREKKSVYVCMCVNKQLLFGLWPF